MTILHGKDRRRITVGRYPAISLSQARAEAKRLLAEITLGMDRPPAISFGEALKRFLTAHCRQRNKPATAKETERLLRKKFLPKLRRYVLDEITTHHITSIVDRLLPMPSEACHAFTAVRTIFRWCTRRRYIPHSISEGLQLPAKPDSKDHVLSDQELVYVIRAVSCGVCLLHVSQPIHSALSSFSSSIPQWVTMSQKLSLSKTTQSA